jgi:hypothetical protein
VTLLGRSEDSKCDSCLKGFAKEIVTCAESKGDAAPPGRSAQAASGLGDAVPSMPVIAPKTASEPPAKSEIAINRVILRPTTVAPGGRFSLEVSYTALSMSPVSFTFTISSGNRELFTSNPEAIDAGNGKSMLHERSLAAGIEPGTYRIRVTLTLSGKIATGEATLTVTAREPLPRQP